MTHSPGPWYLSPTGRYIRYESTSGFNVCDTDVFGGPPEEGDANKRLLAAAPEMLAACEQAIVALAPRDGTDGRVSMTLVHLREVVAKAKGGA